MNHIARFAVALLAVALGASAHAWQPTEATPTEVSQASPTQPAIAAPAAPDASAAPDAWAHRGVTGRIEIEYPQGVLRAKPVRDATVPVLVRVTDLGHSRYAIEYVGLIAGEYNLAEYLERADGRPAGLAALPVRIASQLPPNHGTDVFGLRALRVGAGVYYRELLALGALAWIGVPVFVIVRRRLRRRAAPEPVVAPPAPTPIDLLREAVQQALARDLTPAERGRMELLLLRVLRGDDAPVADTGALARAIGELRRNPRTAGLVLSVERWLHAAPENSAQSGPLSGATVPGAGTPAPGTAPGTGPGTGHPGAAEALVALAEYRRSTLGESAAPGGRA